MTELRGEGMKTKKISLYALLIALALILSYLESLVPMSFAVPGIKMGLPNIVIVFALYKLDFKAAACVSIIRVLLVSLLFGNVMVMVYSLAGAAVSLCLMWLFRKSGKFSSVGVSVIGALGHNGAQVLTAMLLLETGGLIYYLPALCISGTIAGVCIGILGGIIVKRVKIKE